MFTSHNSYKDYRFSDFICHSFLFENRERALHRNESTVSGTFSVSQIEALIREFCNREEISYSLQAVNGLDYVVKFTSGGDTTAFLQMGFDPTGRAKSFLGAVKTKITFVIYGKESFITDFCSWVEKNLEQESFSSVKWFYTDNFGKINSTYLSVDSPGKIYDEFYPFLEGGVSHFLEKFLASNESILILLGPPGTGKTSLIRKMISDYKKESAITYEDSTLEKDCLFIEFMTSDTLELLILEDSDILLQKRKEGNRTMNKLLNVSEGLIKNRRKKLIFTSNETDIDRIDEALIRPGRCFGTVLFRELSYPEICLAAKAAGVDPPSEDRSYPLGELFNRTTSPKFSSRVGFL